MHRQKFFSFGHLCLNKLPQEKNFVPCQKEKALNLETHPSCSGAFIKFKFYENI